MVHMWTIHITCTLLMVVLNGKGNVTGTRTRHTQYKHNMYTAHTHAHTTHTYTHTTHTHRCFTQYKHNMYTTHTHAHTTHTYTYTHTQLFYTEELVY